MEETKLHQLLQYVVDLCKDDLGEIPLLMARGYGVVAGNLVLAGRPRMEVYDEAVQGFTNCFNQVVTAFPGEEE